MATADYLAPDLPPVDLGAVLKRPSPTREGRERAALAGEIRR